MGGLHGRCHRGQEAGAEATVPYTRLGQGLTFALRHRGGRLICRVDPGIIQNVLPGANGRFIWRAIKKRSRRCCTISGPPKPPTPSH